MSTIQVIVNNTYALPFLKVGFIGTSNKSIFCDSTMESNRVTSAMHLKGKNHSKKDTLKMSPSVLSHKYESLKLSIRKTKFSNH